MTRQLCVLIALFGVIFGLLAGSASAAVYPVTTTGQGQVDSSVVESGSCVTFSGSGFEPGTPIVIKDNGKVVGTVTADSNGNFSDPVCFTSDSAIGRHTLTAEGTGANGAARVVTAFVTVMGVGSVQPVGGGGGGNGTGDGSGSGLPFTGVDVVSLVTVGLLLVLSGAGLVARGARRTRRRHAAA